jgi:hypothetical protein
LQGAGGNEASAATGLGAPRDHLALRVCNLRVFVDGSP